MTTKAALNEKFTNSIPDVQGESQRKRSSKTSRRAAVLMEYGAHADWVARPMTEAGFEVGVCDFREIAARLDTGRYNVVVLGRYRIPRHTRQGEIAVMEAVVAAVERHVSRGGGVFACVPVDEQMPFHILFGRFGMEALMLRIVQSSDTCDNGHMIRASAVAEALGEGVSGVWFPANMGLAAATRPLRATSEGWKVALAAKPDSRTEALEIVGYGLPGENHEGYHASVPLIFMREVMPGRLVFCGIPGGYNIFSPNNYPMGRQLLTDGFEGEKSDFLRLFLNALRWLAEPSLADVKIGGAGTDPEALIPQVQRFPADPPVLWAGAPFPPDSRPIKGLIGARTAYSSGRGTPDDYVFRAKAAGHDFIVFLEDFEALDKAKFEALKADCERLSTDSFLAVPGYTIADLVGSRYFQYGYTIGLPLPDILSEDGRTLANKPGNNPRNSSVEQVHFALVFGEHNQMRVRRGTYRHADSPKTILQNRMNDSIALITWEDGRVIEDARDRYGMLADKGLRLIPTALTFMSAPEDFDRAAESGWLNWILEPYDLMRDKVMRKHFAPELEWWGMIDEEVINSPRYRLDCWQYGHPFQSISNGPVVRAWTMSASDRDPSWRAPDHEIPPTGDWFRVDVVHMRLRIHVTSEIGLREVRIYDGEVLFRRWQCDGERTFIRELDLVHHQQRQLWLEASDARGGTVMTSDYASLRLDWCEFYCADRNNPLAIGYEKDERGLAYGWSGNTFLTYNPMQWGGSSPYLGKWWFTGDAIFPVPADPVRDISTPTDGGVCAPGTGILVKLELPALSPPERGLMVNTGQEMISTDVAISGFVCDNGYDPEAPYFFGGEQGFGLYGMFPTRYVRVRRQGVIFRPRPHSLTTKLYQYNMSFKRDPGLTQPLFMGWTSRGDHVLHRSDGSSVDMSGSGPVAERWRRGEAIVSRQGGSRPAIFLNDGADLLLSRLNRGDRDVGLALPIDQLPGPNATTSIRIVAIGGTHEHCDRDLYDQIRRDMGLCGAPVYSLEMEQGEVRSQRLFLEMDAQSSDGVAFTIPRTDLPMALPMIVHGLCDRWPVFFVDRGLNRWRPLGILEGTTYATLDTSSMDWRVFIGHPLTATHRALILSLAQVGERAWRLEVHNPTTFMINADIAVSPYFRLLEWEGVSVSLPPGVSVVYDLSGTPPFSSRLLCT